MGHASPALSCRRNRLPPGERPSNAPWPMRPDAQGLSRRLWARRHVWGHGGLAAGGWVDSVRGHEHGPQDLEP
jgi:hypothetical protein